MENTLREMAKERKKQESWERLWNESTGENIYTDFKAWCNAYNGGKGKFDAYVFAEFLKAQNINIGFWQRKYLAEKYFGYQFEFTGNDWIIKKEKD